jgi:hypothetical protein
VLVPVDVGGLQALAVEVDRPRKIARLLRRPRLHEKLRSRGRRPRLVALDQHGQADRRDQGRDGGNDDENRAAERHAGIRDVTHADCAGRAVNAAPAFVVAKR